MHKIKDYNLKILIDGKLFGNLHASSSALYCNSAMMAIKDRTLFVGKYFKILCFMQI